MSLTRSTSHTTLTTLIPTTLTPTPTPSLIATPTPTPTTPIPKHHPKPHTLLTKSKTILITNPKAEITTKIKTTSANLLTNLATILHETPEERNERRQRKADRARMEWAMKGEEQRLREEFAEKDGTFGKRRWSRYFGC